MLFYLHELSRGNQASIAISCSMQNTVEQLIMILVKFVTCDLGLYTKAGIALQHHLVYALAGVNEWYDVPCPIQLCLRVMGLLLTGARVFRQLVRVAH